MNVNLTISISSIPTNDGRFLPKFSFFEWAGDRVTTIPYYFEDTFETAEEALKVAEREAIREAREKYGSETKVLIKTE